MEFIHSLIHAFLPPKTRSYIIIACNRLQGKFHNVVADYLGLSRAIGPI